MLLLVVAVYIFDSYFLKPKSEEMQEDIQTQYGVLQRYEHLVKGDGITEEAIRAEIAEIESIEKQLVQEKSEILASARLQNEVVGLADKAGLRILTIRPLNAVKTGNYRTMPIYFEGNGDIKQIGEFLRSVETGSMLIKVDKLSLNIMNIQTPKDLKFKIQLSGLGKL